MVEENNMLHWNSFKEKKPPYETMLQVMDLSGKTETASFIYLDDIDKFVWKHEDTYGLFDPEYYPYWREINRKREILHKTASGFKKTKSTLWHAIKSVFSPVKRYWLLTCISEESEIVSQEMYESYQEAYNEMKKRYEDVVKNLGSDVSESYIFTESALIVYDDDPCLLNFKITCIEK